MPVAIQKRTVRSAGAQSGRERGHSAKVVVVRDIADARLPVSKIRTLLAKIMQDENRGGTVQVIVVDDVTMRRLNRRFKGRDKTTDVLSFPLGEAMPGIDDHAIVGEIYCNYAHCKRWVKDNGGTVADELLRLAVHGCLHLIGYDHHKPEDHGRMVRAENRYMNQGGLIRARVAAESERERD